MATNQYVTTNDMAALQKHAKDAANLLKTLGNEHRLLVLCTLMNSELSVGELNDMIPLSQSSLSQHLASLRKAGLVQTRRESQTIYYRLCGDEAIRIISVLRSIYCPDL
jgi:DNA-binding transcriptional ArsR family regulator|tara:strand:+ start:4264 stop:4590 length:327 start_codon:yes stop_codon:yes gene_type:complete